MSPRILLAVDSSTVDLTDDDRVFADALRRRGVTVETVVWGADVIDSPVVIRSTWDYVDRPKEYREWLDELDAQAATVFNPTRLLRWNMHKGYLVELAASGVPTLPTAMFERGSNLRLGEVMSHRRWDSVVVKPAIGATARHTIRADTSNRDEAGEHFRRLLDAEDVLVQPFIPTITTEGELSIIVIGGEPTHVVRKQPAPGEWRVQSNFGGTAQRVPVSREHVDVAQTVLAAVDGVPAYARVDVVEFQGRFHLMELELAEPELHLRLAPEAAERLADVILET